MFLIFFYNYFSTNLEHFPEVTITTPLTCGDGSSERQNECELLSEIDITSAHNSVVSATPDSTIGAGQKILTAKFTDLSQMSGKICLILRIILIIHKDIEIVLNLTCSKFG